MAAPTPPPSSKNSSAEPEFPISPQSSEHSARSVETFSAPTVAPEFEEPDAQLSKPVVASAETPLTSETGALIKYEDKEMPDAQLLDPIDASAETLLTSETGPLIKYENTEMPDAPQYHGVFAKHENWTPFEATEYGADLAASALAESQEVEVKTEAMSDIMTEIKSEFESKVVDFESADLTEPAQSPVESDGKTQKSKQPRRKPAKTPREYHQRRLQDSTGGIRKVRKIVLNVNPEKLLNSITHQDQVSAYNAGPSNGTSPHMTVSTKKDFMQQILSSCPKDSDAFQKFKTELNILDEESRSFGFKRMEMKNGMWLLKGMKSPVYHYQMRGAAWMVEMECSSEGPCGGILADAMGLGKTVQSITTIMANPPLPEQKKKGHRSTLIVVPRTVLHQWKTELETHSKIKSVLIYNNTDTDNNNPRRINMNQVVLTTYAQIRKSFPFPDTETMRELREKAREEKKSLAEVIQDWVAENKKLAGCLHKIHWYRIVLDEAHYIKNYWAQTTMAVLGLRSHYRWGLSGTPAQNGPEDYYPLFCFIREPEISMLTPSEYQNKFCDPENTTELALAISKVTMCRTLKDELLGKKLVDLPPPNTKLVKIKASDPERIFYEAVQARFKKLRKEKEKEKLDDDDPRKELSNILAQITCLRQLTANPDLIEDEILLMFEVEHFEDIQNKLSKVECTGESRVLLDILQDRIKGWMSRKKKNPPHKRSRQRKRKCIMCSHQDSEDLWIISECKHIICGDCYYGIEDEVTEGGEMVTCCPKCQVTLNVDKVKRYKPSTTRSKQKPKSSASCKKGKGRDALGFRPAPATAIDWLRRLDSGHLQIIPTAKVAEIMDKIRGWKSEHPRDKVTIFTQWNHFAIILGTLLQKEKLKFVYITGSMTSQQRNRAVKEFYADKTIHAMILGLKAGGLGLNLTCANRGILVDPWWNKSVENQAHGRIYRIGQKKPTFFVTTVIEDTMDEGVVKLQEEKENNIGLVMKTLSQEQKARLLQRGSMFTEEDGANDSKSDDDESMEDANDNDEVVEDDEYAAAESTEEDEIGEDDESDGGIFYNDEDNGS